MLAGFIADKVLPIENPQGNCEGRIYTLLSLLSSKYSLEHYLCNVFAEHTLKMCCLFPASTGQAFLSSRESAHD